MRFKRAVPSVIALFAAAIFVVAGQLRAQTSPNPNLWVGTWMAPSGSTTEQKQLDNAIDTLARLYSPADTGQLAPGWRDFSRYTLEMCDTAVRVVHAVLRRAQSDDTLPYSARIREPLSPAAVAVAQRCGGRYFADALAPMQEAQMIALLRLALAAQADTLAEQITEKYLARMTGPVVRKARVLSRMVDAYLSAQPVRVELAEAMLARLDALGNGPPEPITSSLNVMAPNSADVTLTGPDVARYRWNAHERFLAHARQVASASELRQILEKELVFCNELLTRKDVHGGVREQLLGQRPLLHNDLFQLTILLDGPRSPAVAAALRKLATVVTESDVRNNTILLEQIVGHAFHLPDSAVRWFPGPVRNTSDTLGTLAAGRATLYVPLDHNNQGEGAIGAYPEFQLLRRLQKTYGPKGLDLVIFDKTVGFSSGSVAQTAEQEIQSIQSYFLQRLALPVTALGVGITPFHRTADSIRVNDDNDSTFGRRCYVPVEFPPELLPNPHRCLGFFSPVLTDRQGKIQWAPELTVRNESLLRLWIDRALR